jgi:peptidoglycan hydrolase-like protein with peptidoglycan-binding domain
VTERTTLRPGMSGPFVLAAQQRLSRLGYWLGTPDGEYGYLTSQAVMALQKAAGIGRDGILGPQTKAALERGVQPRFRTSSGSAIEVDKAHQLVVVVVGGALRYTLNTSTGSGQPYTSDGQSYLANTPEGRFSIQRQIDGERISRLGALWRPKYFYGGYALHGSPSVPAYPASHGCVRLSNPAIDLLWSSGVAPIGRTVWVY